MAQDVSGDVDVSALADGQAADAADVADPISDLVDVINDILNGAQSFDMINFAAASEVTIASGAVTLTQALHTIDTESDAASDNLDTITMDDGAIAFLRANHTDRTVVIRHGEDNIVVPGGNNISLEDTSTWVQVLRSGSSVYVIGSGSGYSAADSDDWGSSAPSDISEALDTLAARAVGRGYIAGLEVSVTANSTVTVAEGECLDDTHSKLIRASAGSVSTASTGINALDTGSVATSTWYYVWVCRGASGSGYVLSTSASSPTLPTGYDDYKRRIGAVKTDGSGNLIRQKTMPGSGSRRHVIWEANCTAAPFVIANAINVATHPTFTTLDFSAVVPSTAIMVKASVKTPNTSGGNIYWRRNSNGGLHLLHISNSSVGVAQGMIDLPLATELTVEVAGHSGDEDLTVYADGYVDLL